MFKLNVIRKHCFCTKIKTTYTAVSFLCFSFVCRVFSYALREKNIRRDDWTHAGCLSSMDVNMQLLRVMNNVQVSRCDAEC